MTARLLTGLKDHFLPHAGNGHVPHALRHRALFGYGLIAVIIKVLTIVVPIALPSAWSSASSVTSANVISLTNETRANLGLPELKASEPLALAAQEKAEDMIEQGYFAHVSPSGLTGFAIIQAVGYRYREAGENLAIHFDSAEGVTEGWLASASHKANIVNPRYTEIGVGVAQGTYEGHPTTMVVQLLAEPAKGNAAAVASPPRSLEATAVPAAATMEGVYGFAKPPYPSTKVLGATVDLDSDVARIYLYAILLLLAATALSVAVKYRHHQLPHVLHAMLIASLGIGLMR